MQHDDKSAAKQDRKVKEWAKLDQTEIDGFLKVMLGRRDGRRYAMWLLGISNGLGLERNLFTGNALSTAWSTGVHEVGRQIFAHFLDAVPDEFFMMLKENADEHRERFNALANARTSTEPYTGSDAYTGPKPKPDADAGTYQDYDAGATDD